MSLIPWIGTEVVGGVLHHNEMVPDYEIFESVIVVNDDAGVKATSKYFVKRTVADCDDIGPMETFDAAESIVLALGISLVQFEEQIWRVTAARYIAVTAELAKETLN